MVPIQPARMASSIPISKKVVLSGWYAIVAGRTSPESRCERKTNIFRSHNSAGVNAWYSWRARYKFGWGFKLAISHRQDGTFRIADHTSCVRDSVA